MKTNSHSPSRCFQVDYMDENEEYFQRQASHRQSRRRFRKINQKGERQTIIDTVDPYPAGKPPIGRGYHTVSCTPRCRFVFTPAVADRSRGDSVIFWCSVVLLQCVNLWIWDAAEQVCFFSMDLWCFQIPFLSLTFGRSLFCCHVVPFGGALSLSHSLIRVSFHSWVG